MSNIENNLFFDKRNTTYERYFNKKGEGQKQGMEVPSYKATP
jgi:hypothetical protein